MNTAIYSLSGTYAGIGFAVPVDTVNRIIPQVLSQGEVTRPYVGVRTNDQITRRFNQQSGIEGLLIIGVEPGSPAEKAGLKATVQTPQGLSLGDVVQAVDGRKIRTVDELFAALERRSAGDEITMQLWREGKTREVKITLGEPR